MNIYIYLNQQASLSFTTNHTLFSGRFPISNNPLSFMQTYDTCTEGTLWLWSQPIAWLMHSSKAGPCAHILLLVSLCTCYRVVRNLIRHTWNPPDHPCWWYGSLFCCFFFRSFFFLRWLARRRWSCQGATRAPSQPLTWSASDKLVECSYSSWGNLFCGEAHGQ